MRLVAGPPCGGKSTYAREHAAPGESVLDFDDLVEALAGDRYSRDPEVTDAALEEWRRRLPASDWVIWTAPLRAQRGRIRSQYGAQVIVVTATETECLLRASAERPPQWERLVRAWFTAFEPSTSGRELIVDTTPDTAARPAEGIFGGSRG